MFPSSHRPPGLASQFPLSSCTPPFLAWNLIYGSCFLGPPPPGLKKSIPMLYAFPAPPCWLRARPVPHLPALLWSWLFLLGPDPCASPGAKVTPQRRPSRDTCYNGSNRVCRSNPTPNSCSPQTLHLLSVLLMHSLLEIGKWSLETLLRARKVLNFRFFSVGDILEMGPKSKHKIHLCLVQICRLAVILYIYIISNASAF